MFCNKIYTYYFLLNWFPFTILFGNIKNVFKLFEFFNKKLSITNKKLKSLILEHYGNMSILHVFFPKTDLAFSKWTKKMSKINFPKLLLAKNKRELT
jgi:ABC-type uncharacterized transport system permease subunit